jgi:Bacterial SH3 domain
MLHATYRMQRIACNSTCTTAVCRQHTFACALTPRSADPTPTGTAIPERGPALPTMTTLEGRRALPALSPTPTLRYAPYLMPLPCMKVMAARSLYLRETPGGPVIGWFPFGTSLEVISQPVDGWVMVQTDTVTGWVSQAWISKTSCPK